MHFASWQTKLTSCERKFCVFPASKRETYDYIHRVIERSLALANFIAEQKGFCSRHVILAFRCPITRSQVGSFKLLVDDRWPARTPVAGPQRVHRGRPTLVGAGDRGLALRLQGDRTSCGSGCGSASINRPFGPRARGAAGRPKTS